MRSAATIVLGLVTSATALGIVIGGCGSDDDPAIVPADGGEAGTGTSTSSSSSSGGGSFVDQISPDATRDPAPECKAVGADCATSADCCTANCDATKKCAAPPPTSTCKASGADCALGTECCTLSCLGLKCANKLCVADNGSCAKNEECCGGSCKPDGTGGGKCAALNPSCKTSGNPCGGPAECCSGYCNGGVCSTAISRCVQKGDICAANFECCGGNCVKAAGAALGTCGDTVAAQGVSQCNVEGTVCATSASAVDQKCGAPCCTKVCGPTGAAPGFFVCQGVSGCAPTGEICKVDSDCCGWSGSPKYENYPPNSDMNSVTCAKANPAQEFGRCDNGKVCSTAGVVCKPADGACSVSNNCCRPNGEDTSSDYCNSNPAACCGKDALGVPRCKLNQHDCTANPTVPANTACVTSADCCGKPCIGGKCQAACIQLNQTCTSTADCCNGLPCVTPTGAKEGICGGVLQPTGTVTPGTTQPPPSACALYGQACTESANCCDSIPCTGGRCRYP